MKLLDYMEYLRRLFQIGTRRFTSRFWTCLQSAFGTQLNLSTTYHPETDGQTERVNQVMEDMLRMYVMDNQTHWEKYLPLVEFAPTITVTIVRLECHHTKLCMEDHAERPLSWDRVRRPSNSWAIIDPRNGGTGDSD
jgi:hypothetical protein